MINHLYSFFSYYKTRAIASGFFILGFLFGNWAVLIPDIKEKFSFDDGQLGLVLLFLPFGAIIFNPIASQLIERFGVNRIGAISMIIINFAYFLPFTMTVSYLLMVSLTIVGMAMTLLNISANTLATSIESDESLSIMAACHGMFSIGLIIGPILRTFTVLINLTTVVHMLCIVVLGLIISLVSIRTIYSLRYNAASETKDSKSGIRQIIHINKYILPLIIISLCVNLTEGAMTDWATVYMRDIVHSPQWLEGWGLAAYAINMALGRMLGDSLFSIWGRHKVLLGGAIIVFIGILFIIMVPMPIICILGFGLIGLGVSCGAPILYRSASNVPGMKKSEGLSSLNSFAMFGFLAGPAFIGIISKQSSLRIAFITILVGSIIWWWKSKRVILY